MAIAFDAATSATRTTTGVVNHTPVGTPKGVVVLIRAIVGSDNVVTVLYGLSAMTEITGSPVVKGTGENGSVYGYFLGASVPTGAQDATVTLGTGGASHRVTVMTFTATGDTAIVDSDGTINSDSATDPSVTLSHGGVSCFDLIAFLSGQDAVTGITPLSGWTSRDEDDLGSRSVGVYTYDTVSTSDVSAGWTQAAEDAVALAVAIQDSGGGAAAPIYLTRRSLLGVGR